jgi:hypothetical protein
MALIGPVVACSLFSAPSAMIAKAVGIHPPASSIVTLKSTQPSPTPAASGGNLNAEFPEFLGEGVIAGLIVLFGYFAGKENQKRRDQKREEMLSMKAALEDFQSSYHKVRFALANTRPFDAQVLSDLFGAKARVDTTADLLPKLQEAQVAKKQTSEDTQRVLDLVTERRDEEEALEERRLYLEARGRHEEARQLEEQGPYEEQGRDVPETQ